MTECKRNLRDFAIVMLMVSALCLPLVAALSCSEPASVPIGPVPETIEELVLHHAMVIHGGLLSKEKYQRTGIENHINTLLDPESSDQRRQNASDRLQEIWFP